ncbi:MAG: hypothetical protein IKI39_05070, partial [Oscillospiraceae bacterium]|nr:hypothetical protein [Oscillospiraceae bacterium]
HYAKLHPANLSWENRMHCLKTLRKIGFQVGCAPFSYGFTWKVYHIRRCHTSGETQNPKQVFPVKFHKRERCTAKKLGES